MCGIVIKSLLLNTNFYISEMGVKYLLGKMDCILPCRLGISVG